MREKEKLEALELPQVSSILHYPPSIVEDDHFFWSTENGPSSDFVIFILTKDTPERLSATLGQFKDSGLPIIVLDDSSERESQDHALAMALESGLSYHGKIEQKLLDWRLAGPNFHHFLPTLGEKLWQLGKCRNYAIALAASAGFSKVIMIDDDVRLPGIRHIARTHALLDSYPFVGSRTTGMPDDSVVGHIYRLFGVVQYEFISGQYLGARLDSISYSFPDIYNEDWIFLLLHSIRAGIASLGSVEQSSFDPFREAKTKALFQEPGELICEGLAEANLGSLRSQTFGVELMALSYVSLGGYAKASEG